MTTTKVYDNNFRLEIAPHSSGPSISWLLMLEKQRRGQEKHALKPHLEI
jgi:hypothetical protein